MIKRSRKILTSEERRAFASAMQAVDFKDPAQRFEIAETIVKELKEEIDRDDVLAALDAEVVEFLPGQSVQWVTRKGLKVFVHEPGAYVPRSVLTNRTQTLYTDRVAVHPEIEITQLKSGRYGSLQEIKDQAYAELSGRKYASAWTTLIGSVATTDANYFATVSGPTSAQKKAAVDSGIDYVADQQGSYPTAIVGRRSALNWLADYAAYPASQNVISDSRKEVMDNQIYPGTYRGLPVVMLNQYKDGYGVNMITNNNIMVVGKGTVKIGVDVPLDFLEGVDINTTMWHMNIFESYGVGVFFPERNARIYLT